jgi:hypothetical protein
MGHHHRVRGSENDMRLTGPQLAFLREADAPEGNGAVGSYKPAERLLALGYVSRTGGKSDRWTYRTTETGKAYLQGRSPELEEALGTILGEGFPKP